LQITLLTAVYLLVKGRVDYYHITCFESIIGDLSQLVKDNHFRIDGWVCGPLYGKYSGESTTEAIKDWFKYDGRTFDILCYENFDKDCKKWYQDSHLISINHEAGHKHRYVEDCPLCKDLSVPDEPRREDYFPQERSRISLSRLLAIVSDKPHIDKWWQWPEYREPQENQKVIVT
jgi:hypothetical protein